MGRGDAGTTYETAKNLGEQLKDAGIDVNFAPLLDVNVNPQSPVIGVKDRSFSSDPMIVALHGRAFAQGLSDSNVAYSFKHFSGHGSATGDTYAGITDVTDKRIMKLKRYLSKNS